VPFTLIRADDDGSDGRTLDGYAAVFDSVTTIDSWEGFFEETIARGAFRKSLRERTPRMQFDHGFHPLIGSLPIGRITEIGEDQRGLHVQGRLLDNWFIEPLRDAIAEGCIDGMSFRFSVVRDEWRDKTGKLVKPEELWELLRSPGDRGPLRRTLKEVKVTEVGPVVWPAYETTTVGVRSQVTIDLGKLNDPAQRSDLARAVFLADAAARTDTPPGPAPTVPDPPDPTVPDAPHPDQDPASGHASSAPSATGSSPGEHPSPTPANPVERAASIRARFRAVTDRYLEAATPHSPKDQAS
jgi:HK97 family phage prohead protease